jgi:2'-5' RNA ligase
VTQAQQPAARLRCFVGAFVERESARRLRGALVDALAARSGRVSRGAAIAALRRARARPVPLGNYHVTLKFLGPVSREALPDVLAHVRALEARPLQVRAVGLTGFPRPAAARMAVAELAPHPRLTDWWAELQARLGAEQRGFRPHVTLVRYQRRRAFEPVALATPVDLELAAPQLYRSDTTPRGSRYTPVTDPLAP